MKKDNALIIVEGIADITFLRDYLIHLNPNFKETYDKKKNKHELKLEHDNSQTILIQSTNGYTNIKSKKSTIKIYTDKSYKTLIIQDTDDKSKSDGGLENRNKYLNELKEELDIDFETFLFPNNFDDGDLETLLLKIVEPTNFHQINTCLQEFINAEEELKLGYAKELSDNKGIIFNYFRAHKGMLNSKEEHRIYESLFWDFNHNSLKELNNFLETNNII